MGLRHHRKLRDHFKRGVFHKDAPNYNINVDGECLRYKGLVDDTWTLPDAEKRIAERSVECLKNIVEETQTYMGGKAPQCVKVYLDGLRPPNKTTERAPKQFDSNLIKGHFKFYCMNEKYILHDLDEGESELKMYLQRDRNVALNIFITNDTDMMSICYNHSPIIKKRRTNDAESLGAGGDDGEEVIVVDKSGISPPSQICPATTSSTSDQSFFIESRAAERSDTPTMINETDIDTNCIKKSDIKILSIKDVLELCDLDEKRRDRVQSSDFTKPIISDLNYSYKKIYEVFDSCVWLDSTDTQHLKLYGFDFIKFSIGFKARLFRTIVALGGTDFTPYILTESAINSIMTMSNRNKMCLNNLQSSHLTLHEMIAMIILFSLQGENVCLKKERAAVTCAPMPLFNVRDFEQRIDRYLDYIVTGIPDDGIYDKVEGGVVVRDFIYAMRNQNDDFSRKALRVWSRRITIDEALDNLKYLGNYTEKFLERSRARMSNVRRRLNFDICSTDEEDNNIQNIAENV